MFSTYNIDVLTEQNHQYLPIEIFTIITEYIFHLLAPSLWKFYPPSNSLNTQIYMP